MSVSREEKLARRRAYATDVDRKLSAAESIKAQSEFVAALNKRLSGEIRCPNCGA